MPYKNVEDKRRQSRKWVRKWRKENPEKAREKSREDSRKFREKSPEKIKQMNKDYAEYQRKWRGKNPSNVKKWSSDFEKRSQRKSKVTALVRKYLGGRCVCCGEATSEFLCVDHIQNNRSKIIKSGVKHGNYHYYTEIKRAFESGKVTEVRKVRKKYQLLCYNCNNSKRVSADRKCAHQRNGVKGHPDYPYASEGGTFCG